MIEKQEKSARFGSGSEVLRNSYLVLYFTITLLDPRAPLSRFR